MHSQNILYPYYSPLKKVLKVNAKQTNKQTKLLYLLLNQLPPPPPPDKTLLFSMFPFLINWGYWSDLGLTCSLIVFIV